jgi:hypothetical protein
MLNGALLILAGGVLLAINFLELDVERYWPMFLLIPAALFLFSFLANRRNAGALVPLAIFVVMAAMFQYCAIYGYDNLEWLWPGFMLGPGAGLFLFYFVNRERTLLIPASILTGLSAIFFIIRGPYARLWPALLIIAGGLLLLRRRKSEEVKDKYIEK